MYKPYLLLAGVLLATTGAFAQSVGVGTAAPAATAMLEVASTTKGMLVPRMTLAQRTAISSPAQGLLVYQTDGAQAGFYYNASATSTANWLWLPDKTTSGDNLGNGTATTAVKLAGNTLSNNGTGGISITDAGNVTVTGNSTVTGASSVAGNSAVTGNGTVAGTLAVGTTTIDAKAALDVTSTTKGLLPPRLTLAQRNSMGIPTVGMLIVQTDNTPGLYQYTATGWASVGAGVYTAESSSTGAAPTTAVNVSPSVTNIVYTNNSSTTIGSVTLSPGTEGQRLVIVNQDLQYLPVVSASGTGNILPGYAVRFIYTNGGWRRES
jgi:parallel beta-helix repeat protein